MHEPLPAAYPYHIVPCPYRFLTHERCRPRGLLLSAEQATCWPPAHNRFLTRAVLKSLARRTSTSAGRL